MNKYIHLGLVFFHAIAFMCLKEKGDDTMAYFSIFFMFYNILIYIRKLEEGKH